SRRFTSDACSRSSWTRRRTPSSSGSASPSRDVCSPAASAAAKPPSEAASDRDRRSFATFAKRPQRRPDRMLPLVLVIASDRDLCEPFRRELSAAGFKAYYVESLPSALAVLAQWRFDAALLLGRGFDAGLLRMLQSLRDAADVPTLAVLDAAGEERQLQALDAGAAQVLVEPTSLRIVAAQLRCL